MKKNSLVIWWLTKKDLEELPTVSLPIWLQSQLESYRGRNGRGRLWVDPRFQGDPKVPEECWVGSLATHCEHCAGFVLSLTDVLNLHGLPGIVTTLDLKRLDEVLLKEGVEEDD